MYLICITEVDDPEIFKICLEYWHVFAHELYTSETQLLSGSGMAGGGGGSPAGVGGEMLRVGRSPRQD